MCQLRCFLCLCLISLGVAAQTNPVRPVAGTPTLTDQQKAQLRQALMKPTQELQAPLTTQADIRRQLSVQERADLRQQLREQRR